MNLSCKIFGHSPETAYYKCNGLFLTLTAPHHDGVGRAHREVRAKCVRCGKGYQIGVCIDAELVSPAATPTDGDKK